MSRTDMEAPAVAKSQKTFYLEDHVARLLDAYQRRTGATFTRAVTAALLQFLLSEPSGPDQEWMEFAVDLEDGLSSIEDIISSRQQELTARGLFLTEGFRGVVNAKWGTGVTIDAALWSSLNAETEGAWTQWKRVLEREGTDAIDKLIAHWSSKERPTPSAPPLPEEPATDSKKKK